MNLIWNQGHTVSSGKTGRGVPDLGVTGTKRLALHLQTIGLRACCKTGWCARAYRRKTRNDSLLGSDAAPRSRPKIASIWSRIQRSKVVSGLARIGVDVISSLSLPTTKKPRPGRVAASTRRRSLQSGTTRPQVRLTRTEHLGYDAADIGFS